MQPSASRAGVLVHCLHPFSPSIPDDVGPVSEAALLGTAVHAALAAYVEGRQGPPPHSGVDGERYRGLVQVGRQWWDACLQQGAQRARAEVALGAIPPRVLRLPSPRDYCGGGASPAELVGTADLLWWQDGCLYIRDWKTGRQHIPVESSWQLRALALLAGSAFDAGPISVGLVHLDEQGAHEEALLLQQDTWERLLFDIPREVPTDGAPPRAGPWCQEQWCPLRDTCEALRVHNEQLARQIIPVELPQGAISPATAARAYEARNAARALLDEFEKRLRDCADAMGGIPVGDGMVWCRVEGKPRVTLDAKRLRKDLGEKIHGYERVGKPSVSYRTVKDDGR